MSHIVTVGSITLELDDPEQLRMELVEDGASSVITQDPYLIAHLADIGRTYTPDENPQLSGCEISVIWGENSTARIDSAEVEFSTVASAAAYGVIVALYRFLDDADEKPESR